MFLRCGFKLILHVLVQHNLVIGSDMSVDHYKDNPNSCFDKFISYFFNLSNTMITILVISKEIDSPYEIFQPKSCCTNDRFIFIPTHPSKIATLIERLIHALFNFVQEHSLDQYL